MKKIALFFVTVMFLVSASAPAFAWNHHGGPDGFIPGLIIGGIMMDIATHPRYAYPPPPPPFYPPTGVVMVPPPAYEVIQQSPTCVEERNVSGQWEQDPDTGAKVWKDFAYPMKKKFYIPCN